MTIGSIAVLFLVLPGFLFVSRRNDTLIEYAFRALGAAAAYWIVSYWFLSVIPLSFPRYILLSLAISLYLLLVRNRAPEKGKKHVHDIGSSILLTIFLAAISIPQWFVLTKQVIPAGNDMSMHAYFARAIASASGFPTNLLPMVPVMTFGSYPFGFSILTALVTKLGSVPILQSALLMTVFSHMLFDISVFLLLRKKYSVPISVGVSVLVAWLSAAPHLFISWGANPTVLSFALLLFGLSEVPDKDHRGSVLLSGMLGIASFLTNYMLPVALCYIAIPLALLNARTLIRWTREHVRAHDILGLSLLLLPFVLHLLREPFHMSEATAVFVRSLHRSELSQWFGKFDASFLHTLWVLLRDTFHPGLLWLYAASLLVLLLVRWKRVLNHIVFIAALAVLIINARFWVLPLSSILYPFRFSMLLLIPMSGAFADVLEFLLKQIAKFRSLGRTFVILAVCIPLGVWFVHDTRIPHYIQSSTESSVAAPSDLEAFRWLEHNTTARDVILNSYFDAGLWIPAAIGRPITVYHTNPVDYEVIRTRVLPRAAYAYVGSKHTDTIDQLIRNVGYEHVSYAPVYEKDGVTIYRLFFRED